MALFSFLAKAVIGGAVSSLFNKKRDPLPTVSTNVVNYQQLVDNSRAAGFNPLTALRNGGSSNATNTTTGGYVPAGSHASQILGAAARGFAGGLASYDPHADATKDLELKIMGAQYTRLNQQIDQYNKIGSSRGLSGVSNPQASVDFGVSFDAQPIAYNNGNTLRDQWRVANGLSTSPIIEQVPFIGITPSSSNLKVDYTSFIPIEGLEGVLGDDGPYIFGAATYNAFKLWQQSVYEPNMKHMDSVHQDYTDWYNREGQYKKLWPNNKPVGLMSTKHSNYLKNTASDLWNNFTNSGKYSYRRKGLRIK